MSQPITRGEALRRLFATNSTAADYLLTAPGYAASLPAGVGYIPMDNFVGIPEMIFYGTDANNEAAEVKLYAARFDSGGGVFTELLATLAVTLGSDVGVNGQLVTASEFFADTVAITAGPYATFLASTHNASAVALTPSTNLIAAVGFAELGNIDGVVVDVNLGTAASLNALYRRGT